MNLFHKEKDLIHRITNFALLLWLVIALFITVTNLVDMFVKKERLSYDDYKELYCRGNGINYRGAKDSSDIGIAMPEQNCEGAYESYKINNRDQDYYTKESLLHCLGNVVIVGSTIFILNRKKD